jgi:hypothetical protein
VLAALLALPDSAFVLPPLPPERSRAKAELSTEGVVDCAIDWLLPVRDEVLLERTARTASRVAVFAPLPEADLTPLEEEAEEDAAADGLETEARTLAVADAAVPLSIKFVEDAVAGISGNVAASLWLRADFCVELELDVEAVVALWSDTSVFSRLRLDVEVCARV